jgi:predicted nucleic acid-binding protein
MIVITDSNIIFSALINPDGVVASIFKQKSNLQFLAPAVLVDETKKHFDKIAEFSKLSKVELRKEFNTILSQITVIENQDVPKKYILSAIDIVADIDYDDAFFVAIHLYKKHKIWTSDLKLVNGLKKKGFDICLTTTQIKAQFYKNK